MQPVGSWHGSYYLFILGTDHTTCSFLAPIMLPVHSWHPWCPVSVRAPLSSPGWLGRMTPVSPGEISERAEYNNNIIPTKIIPYFIFLSKCT